MNNHVLLLRHYFSTPLEKERNLDELWITSDVPSRIVSCPLSNVAFHVKDLGAVCVDRENLWSTYLRVVIKDNLLEIFTASQV